MIDLHCHSFFSDGEFSPQELVSKAIHSNVRLLALTDHDTLDGLAPLHLASMGTHLKIVNGVELSIRWKKHDIHIIGLNIRPEEVGLNRLIHQQNENRVTRAHVIAERLSHVGLSDAYQKATELAGHGRVGRAHFAKILVREGLVLDTKAAFKRYLGRGCHAYVSTNWATLEEAVSVIVSSGGDAVIAHPLKYGLTRMKLRELINDFKRVGGVGMEVVSGVVTEALALEMAGLCVRFELFASTGSDYHNDSRSQIGLGLQRPLPVNCTPIWNQWKDLNQ